MARSLFAGRPGDSVNSLFSIGSRKLLALPTDANGDPANVVLTVWDVPDGTQLTDLLAADGTTPITQVVVPSSTGQIPEFYGPDGVNVAAYVKDPDGKYQRIDARADAAATAAAAAQADAEAARDAALDAQAAAEAVGDTNDAIMASVAGNPTSAFAIQQAASTADSISSGETVPQTAVDKRVKEGAVARVSPTEHAPALGLYFPEAEGAGGAGATDDTAAVLAAAAAVTAAVTLSISPVTYAPRATLHLQGTYRLDTLSGPIVVTGHLSGEHGKLIAPDGYADTVLLIGHATSGRVLHGAKVHAPFVTKGSATSLVAGSVGVQIQNLYNSDVVLGRTTYFETGVWATGYGMGTAYNRIHIGWIDLCKVSLKLMPRTGGWVNSNTWVGGNISQAPNILDGGSLTDKRRPGYRHLVMDGAGINIVDDNKFIGISFEGDLSEYYFDIKRTTNTTWTGNRYEQGTASSAVTLSSDTFTKTGHGLAVGDMVVFLASTSRPGGMTTGAPYYVSAVPDADTFKVAETRGGQTVTFTSNGSGLVYYMPPRFLFDGTNNDCHHNIIERYWSYPGPIDVRRTNSPYNNPVQPWLPQQGDQMPGRNRIINGSFRTNQREYASGTAAGSGTYTFDRWKSTAAGTTLTFPAAPQGQRVTINESHSIAQVIEQANIEAGTYTLSWKGYATGRAYKSGDTPPAYAAAPITVDLDGSGDVVVEFTSATGSGNLSVGEVQLERGAVVTPFERVPASVERLRCQRYFVRFGTASGANQKLPLGIAVADSTTAAFLPLRFPVDMRTAPTLTATNATGANGLRLRSNGGANVSSSAVTSTNTGVRDTLVTITTTGLTTAQAYFVDMGNSNPLLDFSAEL